MGWGQRTLHKTGDDPGCAGDSARYTGAGYTRSMGTISP